jgi:hypothetical protein
MTDGDDQSGSDPRPESGPAPPSDAVPRDPVYDGSDLPRPRRIRPQMDFLRESDDGPHDEK